NQMLLETSVRTTDYAPIGGTYHVYPVPYGPLRYDYRFGLDSVEMSAPRPGLIIFSSTQQPITGGVSDGSLLKTYYNGGTCTNYCQNNPDVLFTIGPHQAMDECDQSIYNVVNLKRITYPYSQGITCTQNMVACGSNSKLDNEDEESMDDLMDDLDEGEIIVYPNPASDQLSIAMAATTSGDYQIEIVDLTGKIMESSVVYFGAGTSVVKFDLSDYTPGYYLISISGADLNIRKTFVKQ
ncbi:MAG TPA: T9SS type A sorting domain-containing protein, partial [Chitinophagales bacterium]|nr:T9SS type A sorting domain-containing protein [Chitinophagales bacterium]